MSRTHQQLDDLKRQLDEATIRMHRLVDDLDMESWGKRSALGGWSIAECMQHLNITSRSYEESIPKALATLRAKQGKEPSRYRRDLFGWLLSKGLEPPARKKFVTAPPFDPRSIEPRETVVAEWERLQSMMKELVDASRGLDLHGAKIVSPFNNRVSYNIYSVFHIITAHQRRHLWQGEQVRGGR